MSRMTLGSVVSGRLEKPTRTLIHGTEGVGNSTFAATAPKPIFICTEDGTSQISISRFPEPQSFNEGIEAIDVLMVEKHEFETLVVATLDWLEPIVWAHVCAQSRKKSIEDFGYGKGYTIALDAWRQIVARLDRLKAQRTMHVVLVAHSWIKEFSC